MRPHGWALLRELAVWHAGQVTSTPTRPLPPKAARRRVTAFIPPQHGAWAFLVVPLLVGFAVAGWHGSGLLFAVAWVAAYPVSYFGGRALTARVRRGSWTRLARREAGRAAPWLGALAVLGIPLLWECPWLALVAVALGAAWAASLALAARYGERSMANDLALVGQAVCAVPLLWAVIASTGGVPGVAAGTPIWGSLPAASAALWVGTAAVGVYLLGSVLAVKSLLREAGNRRFRAFALGYHGLACVVAAWVDPVWLLGFAPALARVALLRPGMRPAAIGGVETVVAALFVAAAFMVL